MTLQSPKAGADKEVNVCANSTEGVYAWGSVGGGPDDVWYRGIHSPPAHGSHCVTRISETSLNKFCMDDQKTAWRNFKFNLKDEVIPKLQRQRQP